MPIHPSQGNYENTLANAAAYYFASQNIPFTYRCINRLDRDTTGLLIIAKHMYSRFSFVQYGRQREIHREYLAAATGLVEESGMIEAPIGRANGSTMSAVSVSRTVIMLHPFSPACLSKWVFSRFSQTRDRAHPPDPCSYEIYWASASGRFSLPSRGSLYRPSGTALLPTLLYPSNHKTVTDLHSTSARRYAGNFSKDHNVKMSVT